MRKSRSSFLIETGVILALFILSNFIPVLAPISQVSANPIVVDRQLIPNELGSVYEVYQGKSDKTVIYIQDAHGSLEAQQNIAKIIGYLIQTKGVRTVFEEGYEGSVPSDQFFGFIPEKDIKERIAYFFLDQLKLGGAEYAHINRTQDFKLIGADSLKWHAQNIVAYQKTFQFNRKVERDLSDLEALIRGLSDSYFPNPLKQQIKWKERFSAGTLDLLGYIERIDPLLLKSMTPSEFQIQYPYLWAIKTSKKLQDEKGLALLRNAAPRMVFEEIEKAEGRIANYLLKSEDQLEIYHYQRALALLRRLAALQVTPQEYEATKDLLERLRTETIGKFLAKHTRRTLVLSKAWERYIKNSIEFYEIAKKREQSIQKLWSGSKIIPMKNQPFWFLADSTKMGSRPSSRNQDFPIG